MLYQFSHCQLDEETRSLMRAGRSRHVQPKVMDLLLFLVRHRARVISRMLLVRELWPDVVVSETSLTRLVKEARRAVGDDGRGQDVIRTLHGRGYQFVADIRISGDDPATEAMRRLELARLSLEGTIEVGSRDVRERIRDFVLVCEEVVRQARVAQPLSG